MAIRYKTQEELAREGGTVNSREGAEAALAAGSYEKSQAVLDAENQLAAQKKAKPAAYVSAYQEKIDGLVDRILNRGAFAYDFNAEPLYQAYKDQYLHSGRLAMQDTLASAAAATGGYGSSYAVSAGSQAYQNYADGLNGRLPELYSAALARYKAGGEALTDQLSALTAQEKNAQAAYEDSMSDYYKGLSAYASLADKAYEQDYGAYTGWQKATQDARDYYAGQQQQTYKNQLSEKTYALALEKYRESVRQWEAQQAAAQQKWQAQLASQQEEFAQQMAYRREQAARSTAKSSGKTGTGSSGSAKGSGGSAGKSGSSADGGSSKSTARGKAGFTQSSRNAWQKN